MEEAAAQSVAQTVGSLYRDVHAKMREQVRGMDHGTLNWSPLPKANSIAVLVTHTLGSEREMIRALRQAATERDRESAFKAEATAAALLALPHQSDRDLADHIGALTPADP